MYLLILLVLVLLILFYFALDNVNLILNLFRNDLERQKSSKAKKSSKTPKKLEKPPVEVPVLQRYLNFPAALPSLQVVQSYFFALKDQVQYNLQDVRYVCNTVRDFWVDLTKGEEGEIVGPNSSIDRPDKTSKSGAIQKVAKKSSTKNLESGKQKASELQDTKLAKENKSVKFFEKSDDKEPSLTQDKAQKSKNNYEKNTSKTSSIQEKGTKKIVENVYAQPSASINVVETKKKKSDHSKQNQEKNKSQPKEFQKGNNTKIDQESLMTSKENETKVASKTKPEVDKNKTEKVDSMAIEKQNVITLEKNSKGKKKITIEQNELSGIKTVLVKKSKQTVYKKTENTAEMSSIKDNKDSDKSIGKLTSEELELLVKSFSAQGQDKTENLIDIIQQVKNMKKKMEQHFTPEKDSVEDTASASDGRQKENIKAFVRAKTTSAVDTENFSAAKEKVKRKLSEDELSQIDNMRDKSTEIAPVSSDNSEKSVDVDPVLEKIEKIKNHDFENIGKLSFDELAIIAKTLLSENLVPVPKFSDPPYRKNVKKPSKESRDINDSERKIKSESKSVKQKKRPKDENILSSTKLHKETSVPQQILVVPNTPVDKNQSNESNVAMCDYVSTEIENKEFPNIKETHFGLANDDLLVKQELDETGFLDDGLGTSGLSKEMILCEKNTVKNISALLEDDAEVQFDIHEQDIGIKSLKDPFCPTTPNVLQSEIHTTEYFTQNNIQSDLITTKIEQTIQVDTASLYDTRDFSQYLQEEREQELKIDQIRKAVVQELKDNFNTLCDETRDEKFESGVPAVDNNHSSFRVDENILIADVNLQPSLHHQHSFSNDDIQNKTFIDEVHHIIFTSDVENSETKRDVILFEHTEMSQQLIENGDQDEVSINKDNIELKTSEKTLDFENLKHTTGNVEKSETTRDENLTVITDTNNLPEKEATQSKETNDLSSFITNGFVENEELNTTKDTKDSGQNEIINVKASEETAHTSSAENPIPQKTNTTIHSEEISQQYKETTEQIEKTLEPTQETSEQIEKTLEPTQETSEQIEKTLEPTQETSEQIGETSQQSQETSQLTEESSQIPEETSQQLEVTSQQFENTPQISQDTSQHSQQFEETSQQSEETSQQPREVSQQFEETSQQSENTSQQNEETSEQTQETSAEILEGPETNSKTESSSPKQTSTVRRTLVRPVIKIDRCGDNKFEEWDVPSRSEEVRSSNKMVIQQQTEVRVLTLQDNQHQDGVLYRLKVGWALEFRLGESLFGRRVSIFCNLPEDLDTAIPVQRVSYRGLEWASGTSDDTANYIRVPLTRPGSYHYYFTFEGSSEKRGSGYLVVDPVLSLGGEPLPLDAIQCVTVLSRCLGPFPSWEKKLQVAKESGYNMVHFTPVQELGGSNSCYSLASQLDLNPVFNTPDHRVSWQDLAAFTERLRTEWKMLSICDIVLNHTANETPWLRDHPEASYNLVNSPHLKPAYLLDVMLQQLSDEIESGTWQLKGVPRLINNEDHLNALRHLVHTVKLPAVRIPELYSLDVELLINQFQERCRTSAPVDRNAGSPVEPLSIQQDPEFRRLKSSVDLDLALRIYNVYRNDCFDEDARIKRCVQEFKAKIDELNSAKIHEIQDHLNAAVENFIAGVRYYRVAHEGPRHGEISAKTPLIYRYFTDPPGAPAQSRDPLQDIGPETGAFVMCHNGWVMGADPLVNFAAPGSHVYLRRELIAWGDSVKLRFGDSPADNPWLWDHMRRYVEATARTFDGLRLDNCHSTPLPVAEYLLAAARTVRPHLYVVAELFTNSPETDNIFVNRLAITSLIREAMSAWDSHELGRLVYLYGGPPIGAFIEPPVRPLAPAIAHALLLDQSHDNPCPLSKRSVFDLLPSGALVCVSGGASGSTSGYDTLVPHQIDVVEETRQYPEWEKDVSLSSGIIAGKRALNRLHSELGLQGYTQVFVDQVDSDIVAVTRHHPSSHESVLLVAFTCFSAMTSEARGEQGAEGKGVTVAGSVASVILEAGLRHGGGDRFKLPDMSQFSRDPRIINGLTDYQLDLVENVAPSQATFLHIRSLGDGTSRLDFTSRFKPGCVLAVRVSPVDSARSALSKLSLVFDLSHNAASLSLADLNKVLYCCGEEDGGTYNVPGSGPLVYCGLQGILSLMTEVARTNDLGHPVCANLRDGPWLAQYMSARLRKHPGTAPLAEVLHVLMEPLKSVPPYLVPCYFHLVLTRVMEPLVERCYDLMSDFVRNGSSFVKALALTSVQMGGIVADAPLPPLSPSLSPPLPPLVALTCAAGLPHFSTGYMRNWGRDTFIALRGLFLLTGRYQEARFIILGFAGTLRHGLIPNLLDGGYKARYNCRDAVWWWLYTLQSYVQEAPNGLAILQDKVNRLYPHDDDEATSVDQPLYEVVQEAVERHFQGVVFRERNAGTAIDAHMVSQGFDNQIGVHPVTGFVFGGNQWNCGTWMDKMGSSSRAGTKGRPATPRDGSPVELVGLSKAAVRWLAQLNRAGDYPYSGVSRTCADGTRITWSFAEWNDRIQASFEPHFHIPLAEASNPNEARPELINRRGIYKDTYGSSQPWADYQLRCNYPVAMVVAPELFTPSLARTALSVAEATLLGAGPGMRTLDPSDWSYRGDYNNDNDSDDASVAHGFNYHNGPEWLWPVGFFLRAKLTFSTTRSDTIGSIRAFLARHYAHITSSPWRGLPELTNKDGKPCPGSCPTQAWSGATILEVMYDISQLESEEETRRQ